MSEVKGIVERIVKEHIESLNRDKFVVLIGGKTYDCWSSRINDFLLKELPAGTTMTPAKDEKYNPKLNLPQEGGGGFKKPFAVRDDSTTAWDTILMQAVELNKMYAAKDYNEALSRVMGFHKHWWAEYKKDVKKEG